MKKSERIARLRKAYRHERKALSECKGDATATADEQRRAVTAILTSIQSQLRLLCAEVDR